jgi:hypothetical protein
MLTTTGANQSLASKFAIVMGRPIFRICSGSEARFISMAGRKTRHPQRKPRAKSPPSREGENIQSGGKRLGSEVADKNPRIPGRRDVSAECAAMRAEGALAKKLKD